MAYFITMAERRKTRRGAWDEIGSVAVVARLSLAYSRPQSPTFLLAGGALART